jgi:hypothetical protein
MKSQHQSSQGRASEVAKAAFSRSPQRSAAQFDRMRGAAQAGYASKATTMRRAAADALRPFLIRIGAILGRRGQSMPIYDLTS